MSFSAEFDKWMIVNVYGILDVPEWQCYYYRNFCLEREKRMTSFKNSFSLFFLPIFISTILFTNSRLDLKITTNLQSGGISRVLLCVSNVCCFKHHPLPPDVPQKQKHYHSGTSNMLTWKCSYVPLLRSLIVKREIVWYYVCLYLGALCQQAISTYWSAFNMYSLSLYFIYFVYFVRIHFSHMFKNIKIKDKAIESKDLPNLGQTERNRYSYSDAWNWLYFEIRSFQLKPQNYSTA